MHEDTIHFANPKAQFEALRQELMPVLERVSASGWYILGEEVARFESAFAAYTGAAQSIGVANGTDALALALRAVGVQPGDEVISVSHSAVATTAAIELIGAVPVFCDIDSATRGMDPQGLQPLLSTRTKAIVPVHIYGQPCAIVEIAAFAKRNGLALVEDCAQAHGARVDGRHVGTFGDLGAFSFYPTKNLGAMGDGGAVITNDAHLAERVRLLRQYGWRERYVSEIAGWNSRLDEMQAALLSVKLKHLENWNERRRAIAQHYCGVLDGERLTAPPTCPGTLPAMHLCVIESNERGPLQEWLRERGILCGIHYPQAIHQQPAYAKRVRTAGKLERTEYLYRRILSLPLYPELSDTQVERVAGAIKAWLCR